MAGVATADFYLALWGIRPLAANLTDFNNPIPSWISSLKEKGLIRSLSWAYTAGCYAAFQGNKQSMTSLTLGGYNEAIFVPSNSTLHFNSQPERDLSVGVQNISLNGLQLLSAPILALLDSTVPHLWLPEECCQLFESQLELVYNETLNLYLINSSSTNALLHRNLNISFHISNDAASPADVTIQIPLRALVLNATNQARHISGNATYFPIRRAANSTQFTLGRAFFQYAYVIADYERSTFSVNQILFPSNTSEQLRAISPPTNPSVGTIGPDTAASAPPSGLSAGVLAGIVIGSVIATVVILGSVTAAFRAWRKTRPAALHDALKKQKAELDAQGREGLNEVDGQDAHLEPGAGDAAACELDNSGVVMEADSGWQGHEISDCNGMAHELE